MNRSIRALLSLLFLVLASCSLAQAQPYETNLTTTAYLEDFNELGGSIPGTNLPSGWVFAQGMGNPRYGAPLDCEAPPHQFITNNPPVNCLTATRVYDGGATGGSATPTGGGRVNYGDTLNSDRSVGFMSLNSSSGTDYRSPTNHLVFGFTNNTGDSIASLAITNNIKLYRDNVAWSSGSNPHVEFYYSYDGTNWTHFSGGDVGPFPYNTSSTYYFANPGVSNVSFNLAGVNIPNGSPFYLDWKFVIANASGSFSFGLGLDDVGITATLGVATVPSAVWVAGSGNWSSSGNWLGSILPVNDARVRVAGSGGNMNQDIAALATGNGTLRSITFSNSAGASYNLSGNPVTLTEGLTNNSSFAQTINNNLTLGASLTAGAYAGNLNLGNITNAGATLTVDGASATTISGIVSGTGGLAKIGNGILTLSGANAFTGPTTVSAGTLRLGAANRIPDGSAVTVDGTLDLNNFNETLASLAGGGNVLLGSATLVLSNATGSATFSGAISGAGSVVKNGDSTENFTDVNTYHGDTLLNSGGLQLGGSGTIGDGAGTLFLNGGTLISGGTRDTTNGIIANPITMTADTIIQNTTSATAGTRNFPFGTTNIVANTGTLTIRNITTGNFTNIMNLRLMGGGFTFSRPIVFDNSTAANATNNTCQLDCYSSNGTPAQIFTGAISGIGRVRRGALIPGDAGTTILTAQNTFSNGTVIDAGFLGVGSSSISSGGVVQSGPVGTDVLQVNNSATVGIFAYNGAQNIDNFLFLNGVTNFQIVGSNNLTFSGPVNVGGVAKTLTVNNSGLTTFNGQLTNTSPLTKAGNGTLVFTADNPWSGGLTINAGTVLANNTSGSALGSGPVVLNPAGTLGGNGIVAGAVSGAGTISPANPGLTLAGGLDLSAGGTYLWELSANSTAGAGVNFDQIALTGGNLNLGGSSKLSIQFAGTSTSPDPSNVFWQSSHSWRIIVFSGTATNSSGAAFGSILNGTSSAGTFSTTADASGILLVFTPGTGTPPPVLSRTISGAGTGNATLTWSAVNGVTYQVQYKTNLNQNGWLILGNTTAFGSTGTLTDTSGAHNERYYRIVIP